MKKIFVFALCIITLFAFAACGSYNDSELSNRISQLEQELADAKAAVKGDKGEDGETPCIGNNGNWYIGNIDTGIKAQGSNGSNGSDGSNGNDGVTPRIGTDGYWYFGDTKTDYKAQGSNGTDGVTPSIGEDGFWYIGEVNTNVKAQGGNGADGVTPYIGSDGFWYVDDAKTEIKAQGDNGNDGVTPHIGTDGYWYFGETKTDYKAQGDKGTDGVTPHIGEDGYWYIDDTNTGVKAQGSQGEPGDAIKVYKLGDTFTYICAGKSLFSIKLEAGINPLYVSITIKNLDLLGLAPADFTNLQVFNNSGYLTETFSATILPLNDEYVTYKTYTYASNGIWFFGFPALKCVIPYAIFDLN